MGRERSFTSRSSAARRWPDHPPLEARLGVRLLTIHGTSRQRRPASAFAAPCGSRFEEIDAESRRCRLAEKPSGPSALRHQYRSTRSWPEARRLLRYYPYITVEMIVDYGLTNIVPASMTRRAQRQQSPRNDRGAPAGSERGRVVAPAYFKPPGAERRRPDRTNCINRVGDPRQPLRWEFEEARELKVRSWQLTFTATAHAGLRVAGWVCLCPKSGRRISQGLSPRPRDWCPPYPLGLPPLYPSRRPFSAAFSLVVEALRYRVMLEFQRASSYSGPNRVGDQL